MRKLDIGKIEDGSAVINSGIEPGERVVTSGYYRLQPGIPVEIRNGEDENSGVKRSAARPDSVEVE